VVTRARAAVYRDAGGIDAAHVARYCERLPDGSLRIGDALRDAVTFARQDILTDPPFTSLDLVSCQNVMIYLERAAQEAVASLFAYALRPGGYLVLGLAEMTFVPALQLADRTVPLYRRTGDDVPLRALRRRQTRPLGVGSVSDELACLSSCPTNGITVPIPTTSGHSGTRSRVR
jgi:SAM-dependent methyltransferase